MAQPTPDILATLMAPFAARFTRPTFANVLVLVAGAILAPGRRTVASALSSIGRRGDATFTTYHRVPNRSRWSGRAAARRLLGLLVGAFWPSNSGRTSDPVLIFPSTGLVGHPLVDAMGVIVRTLFQQNPQQGSLIQVQSSITGACRMWRVNRLTYELACETPGRPWFQGAFATPQNQMGS